MKNLKDYFKRYPSVFIIAGSIALFMLLVASGKEPVSKPRENLGPVVQVVESESDKFPITIYGTGVIKPKLEATLSPEVSGIVIDQSPKLVRGGKFVEGEAIYKIDSREYAFALQQAKFELAKAQEDLEKIKSRARLAKKELERLSDVVESEQKAHPLTLFKPQQRSAKARVKAAKAMVSKAKLDIERTIVKAPFNCQIIEETIDIGQRVGVGEKVLRVIGTDQAEIYVSLPLSDTRWLLNAFKKTSKPLPSVVLVDSNKETFKYSAKTTRLLGDVDPKARMNRVAVELEDPFSIEGTNPPLSIGTFARVEIEAGKHEEAVRVPRYTLREGNTVWLVDEKDRLQIVKLEPTRLTKDWAYISKGLKAKAKVIVTPLSGVVDGMKVRPIEKEEEGA